VDSSNGHPVRIAYFSPLPPERSGISDYSAELLPHLTELAQVTLFASDPELVTETVRCTFEVRHVTEYNALHWQYDIPLYQMGNSMYHNAMYRVLRRYPGITVLHDFSLHHFIAARTIGRNDFAGYARELGYSLGASGVELAYQISQKKLEPPYYTIPLNERILDASLGVIVHSHYVKRQIQELRPNLPVAIIPAPIRIDPGPLRSRHALGCAEDVLLFASAGQLVSNRQIAVALEAFAKLHADFPEARYVLLGGDLGQDLSLQTWLYQPNLNEVVFTVGYLENLQDYISWITAADVLVNLRSPTVGETSATALRGLAAGRPVIVSNHGWYAELPDDVCVKVTPNDGEAVYQAMRRLAGDAMLRQAIGRRAAAYAQREHSLAAAARKYIDFVDEIIERVSGRAEQMTA